VAVRLCPGPRAGTRAAAQLHAMSDGQLRAVGGVVVIVGLLSLHFVRGG